MIDKMTFSVVDSKEWVEKYHLLRNPTQGNPVAVGWGRWDDLEIKELPAAILGTEVWGNSLILGLPTHVAHYASLEWPHKLSFSECQTTEYVMERKDLTNLVFLASKTVITRKNIVTLIRCKKRKKRGKKRKKRRKGEGRKKIVKRT